MKKIVCVALLICTTQIKAQTNVSGGIYSNTTWSLSGSPYIVTNTVVVFPGVTLTIQPGVVVKFNSGVQIEVRQAQLLAIGTKTDSITFTSNASLAPGSWNQIYLDSSSMSSIFNYCNFKYATNAIYSTIINTLTIKNSSFNSNQTGVYCNGTSYYINNAGTTLVDSCVFNNNSSSGLSLDYLISASISNCSFLSNGTGFGSIGYHGTTTNCAFYSNQTGLNTEYMLVNNCIMKHNQTGFYSGSENTIKNSTIDSNTVTGILAIGDSVNNCQIKYNGVGVQTGSGSTIKGNDVEYNSTNISGGGSLITGNTIANSPIGINDVGGGFAITKNIITNNSIGIIIKHSNTTINCNKICSNSTYDLKYLATNDINASNNYWCTSDSAATRAVIYDGYDNITYGLVAFMPIDSVCYLTTGIQQYTNNNEQVTIYPNPASSSLQVSFSGNIQNTSIEVYNTIGECVHRQIATSSNCQISVADLAEGVYQFIIPNL